MSNSSKSTRFYFYFNSVEEATNNKEQIRNILNSAFYTPYVIDIYKLEELPEYTLRVTMDKLEITQLNNLNRRFRNITEYDGWAVDG